MRAAKDQSPARADGDAAVGLALSMVLKLPPSAQGEISRALVARLLPKQPVRERRISELRPLSELLERQANEEGIPLGLGRGSWRPQPGELSAAGSSELPAPLLVIQRYPVVPQPMYDQQRPPDAPSGEELSARFGGWHLACRAAFGVLADGRYRGLGQPWPSALKGRPRVRYTGAECIEAIRRCALAYGRRPTSNLYIEWSAKRRRHSRACRAPDPRLPTYEVFRKRFGGWAKPLAVAAISDEELAAARAARAEPGPEIPEQQTPAGRLRAAEPDRLAATGISPADVDRVLKRGFGWLPLSRAAELAQSLGGSLDWLAGRDTEPGGLPPLAPVLDVDAVRRLRRDRRIPDPVIRGRLDLVPAEWRRLLERRDEPSLAIVAGLASLFAVRAEQICAGARAAEAHR